VVIPIVTQSFSKKAVYCGPSGSGMAMKAINNILNTAHCLLAAEGMLALKAFGVEPDTALEVLNSSSGRSLATQERIPQEILNGRFGFGFKLGLMAKDCRIAGSLVNEYFPAASLLPEVMRITNAAEQERGALADYTEVIRSLEIKSGINLRGSMPSVGAPSKPKSAGDIYFNENDKKSKDKLLQVFAAGKTDLLDSRDEDCPSDTSCDLENSLPD
jgi:NAD-binding of NADP-dependent 3-hydroxyisobutyrate dehydrogenase